MKMKGFTYKPLQYQKYQIVIKISKHKYQLKITTETIHIDIN